MKKILNYLIVFVALGFVAAGGCDRYKYDEPAQSLFVVESDLDFTAEGGTGAIYVRSDKGAITAESNKEWCSVSVSGMTVNVTVAAFSDIVNRTALVTVETAGGESQVVPVTQSAGYFIVENLELTADWEKGVYEVGFTALGPVTAESTVDWITVSVSGDTVIIEVAEYEVVEGGDRYGYVQLTFDGVSQYIEVTQVEQPFYKITKSELYGEWTYSYTDSLGNEQTRPITLEAITTKINAIGIFPDEAQAQKLVFVTNTCDLTLDGWQWIYSRNDEGYKCFCVGVDSSQEGEATDYRNTILRGKFNGSKYDQEYTFVDEGTWAGHTIDGIARGISNLTADYIGEFYGVMYNLKLSREVPRP